MPTKLQDIPDGDSCGMRVDAFLSLKHPDLSRSYIQELISAGGVTINGKKIKPSRKTENGIAVDLEIPDPVEPEILPQKMDLDILYEDSDVLIVNKPKGMTVHPAPGHPDGTLVNGILAHCGDSLSGINGVMRPGIVHRIDQNTTGSLIICKNDAAHRCIAEQLKDHSITRKYLGIVIGNLSEDSGRIEGNIGRSPKDRKKMSIVREGGKPAVTYYRVLEQFAGYSLCEFTLETGRTHQIRVHMSSIGHPLLGDDVYGPQKCPFQLEGQTLHAATIGFMHPRSKTYMEFEAPLPDYFKDLITLLRKRNS